MKFKIMKILVTVLMMFSYLDAEESDNFVPSVYFGIGLGTNIGGIYGIGSELKLKKYFSINFAVGSNPYETDIDSDNINEESSRAGVDFGMKFYPLKYVYLGLNYGSILEGEYALSFTVGVRTASINNLYLSGYFGTTSSNSANNIEIGESTFIPRVGGMLGYEFN